MINFKIGFKNAPKNVNEIIALCEQSNFSDYNLPEGAIQKVKRLLSENSNDLFSLYENNKTILIAVFAEKETNSSIQSENIRLFGASVLHALEKEKVEAAKIKELRDCFTSSERLLFLEGISLAHYTFERYKKKKKASTLTTLYLEEEAYSSEELNALSNLIKAVSFTKDLVNQPVNYLDASAFSELAINAGKECGFTTEVFDKSKIEELKMGGLLAVNQGSDTPPTFNIFTHKPADAINIRPLILVGKGVMFDTGGYSLKTGNYMSDMKTDMAGGASVLGTMMAISMNKLPYYVIGLVPATDNKISANALVVDDVITMYDGTTVEVQNTDAEGRLVLADALAYAKQFNPELVIDLATLTGAAASITGDLGSAMAGNNASAMEKLKLSGENVYERLVELPMWKEFEELLKSEVADLKNIGGRVGGATTAAKFLEHFTDYDWIHLDIAGPASLKKKSGYKQAGGTAVGVRLLYNFIESQIRLKQHE
ncbi:MAG TPA: leucyl aminopeptidase [Dysgonamonadaceae bacterium]|nr:leucyl aminopeptidase [Dysgonamonadaceae bacterium]